MPFHRRLLLLPFLVLFAGDGPATDELAHARAHWLDARTLAWPDAPGDGDFALHAGTGETPVGEAGTDALPLTVLEGGLPAPLRQRFPHLAGAVALALPELAEERLRTLVTRPLAISVRARKHAGPGGGNVSSTGVQLPGVLDVLFPYGGPLGVVFENGRPVLRLWAPTARSVTLLRYADATSSAVAGRHALTRDEESGTWSIAGSTDWNRQYYRYEIEVFAPWSGRVETLTVTDPYSLGLAADSERSQIVDLADPDLAPAGWNDLVKPEFTSPVDMVIYELHLRDFSVLDESVPARERGTFRAFRHADALGMRHLARLEAAGLTHVHLLPVFDIATVPERRDDQRHPDPSALAALPPDSTQQQALVSAVRDRDGFNWGYDPWHYTVPEGSYATDPDGEPRIREFREMVMALNQAGLRVIMDVVYNHTHASGAARGSVLDQVVPGYYHRLDADGAVTTSTCCANTASEHRMMEKLMIDSVLTWARDYKVDGFRFDLMGHHSRGNMVRLRAALDALTLERDGVDGRAIVLYGEGWNFGEVANDARFVQARQGRLAGTGIGTFSDRLRDGARGGLYDSPPPTQGFINGLVTDPSAWTRDNGPGADTLLKWTDWIRTGLAGDLAAYEFDTADGKRRPTGDLDYGGSPAGYTASPGENISYVAAHDNETLFDANQVKLPVATSMADRVRVQTLGNALVLLGQGVPFIHAGQEFLRSKSLDRDSYDSGDWFNAIDWRFETSNWGRGLPPTHRNEAHWDLMRPLLGNPALAPAPADQRQALDDFEALLRIRQSSRLFRLRDLASVQAYLAFHNTGPDQVPGLIVMRLSDPDGRLEDRYRDIVVFFNARPAEVTFTLEAVAGAMLAPHPDQPPRMAGTVDAGVFTIPPRSVAVFVGATP